MEDLSTTHSQPEATLGKLYNPSHSLSWQTQSLYTLADWANGLAFKDIQFTRTGKPIIKIAEIKNGITDQTKFTDGSYDQRIEINAGDILFAWSGQPETSIGVSKWHGDSGWLNQHIFKISPKEGIDREFFFFLLMYLNPYFVKIAKNKQTTGLGHVTKEDLRSMMVGVPEIEEQRDIARSLLPIQRKIELLQAQSRDLEEMMQRLFKEWFVDFNFPSTDGKPYKVSGRKMIESEYGEIPEEWQTKSYADLVNVLSGGTPKTDVPEYWNGQIPFFTPKDAKDTFYVDTTEKYITEAGLSACNSKLYPKDTVFITARGTVGKCALALRDMAMNQSCYALVGKDISNLFVFLLTKQLIDVIKKSASGAVFDAITVSTFNSLHVALGDRQVTDRFETLIRPMFNKIANNTEEIFKLAELRDQLLPKLMCGELTMT